MRDAQLSEVDANDEIMEAPKISGKIRASLNFNLINRFSIRAINSIYHIKQRPVLKGKNLNLYQSLFPAHGFQNYFNLYGKKGFCEYQAVIPFESISEYLAAIKHKIIDDGALISLASAKIFDGPQDLLRFSGKGVCFALNFPRNSDSAYLLKYFDDRLIEYGGIPNIIKDSRLPRAVLDACYPEADKFRASLHEFDPRRIFQSELSKRLDL
jgi:decaprenylphospho-beta-D-ribofuranose 2-oxidase